jgi:hypothetical protein
MVGSWSLLGGSGGSKMFVVRAGAWSGRLKSEEVNPGGSALADWSDGTDTTAAAAGWKGRSN